MTSSPPGLAQVTSVRNIRRIAALCAVIAIAGAAFIVYTLGLAVHPHRVGFAAVFAGLYLVVWGGGYSLVYRAQMRAARRL